MRRLWQSLSFRLALAYAVLLCVSVGLLSAVYYWIAVVRPLNEIRAQVDREAHSLAQIYVTSGQTALIAALDRRLEQPEPRRPFHVFLSAEGKLVSGNLPSWPTHPARGWFSIEADVYHEGDELDFSALSLDRVFPDGTRLIVGRDAELVEDRGEVMLMALPWVLGLTIAFGVVGGMFMSRTIGRRLDSISSAARQVIAGDLGGRVTMAGKGDDFDRLAGTLNFMLARNQDLFEAVRRISDNVAHELRTPLARLIARLEQLERRLAEVPGTRPDIEAALAEAGRMQAIFGALLRIARIEEGRHDSSFRDVDLTVLASDAVELYAPSAEATGIDLQFAASPGIIAWADPDLIFQAVTNLLDNALKHTPAGGTVRVEVRGGKSETGIAVSDSGEGLQPGEKERITERFFRGRAAQGLPGEGLGLSLVAAVASLHHARLEFCDGRPGLRVYLAIPTDGRIG